MGGEGVGTLLGDAINAGPGDGDPTPRWRSLTIPAAGLHSVCRSEGATINDGLVAMMARIARARATEGPVCTGYTVDLRRFLPERRWSVTNLHGVSLLLLPRTALASPRTTLRAVSGAIGEQKRRLPGLAYVLLPALLFAGVPHAILRVVGRPILGNLLRALRRTVAFTNIGSLDEALALLGPRALQASIVGPFLHGLLIPVVDATGFRGTLTLHAQATGSVTNAALDGFVADLRRTLTEIEEG